MSADTVRERLEERKLGTPVPEHIWRELVEVGAVEQVRAGAKTDDWLMDRVLNLAPGLLRVKADPMLTRRQIAERQEIVSHLVAHRAAADESVQQVRAQVGRLLRPDQVSAWIEEQTDTPTLWLEIALPADATPVRAASGIGLRPAVTISEARPVTGSVHRRFLEYRHSDGWVRRVPTAHGGRLDQLRQVSESLAARYGWQPAQATIFVLTGETPLVRAIKADWTPNGRLLLNIEAGVSPRQLVIVYRALRRQLVGKRRDRSLTEHQRQLAQFLATRPADEPWAARRKAWDRAHPNDAYGAHRAHNFRRACETITNRLLQPIDAAAAAQLTWDRIEGKRR